MQWSLFWTLSKQSVGCARCERTASTKRLLSDSTLEIATRIFPTSSDARQRLSVIAKWHRRTSGASGCGWDQNCGFKPHPYSGAELLYERFFGGPIMGAAYRAECGIHLLSDLRAGSDRIQSLEFQAGLHGGGKLRVRALP